MSGNEHRGDSGISIDVRVGPARPDPPRPNFRAVRAVIVAVGLLAVAAITLIHVRDYGWWAGLGIDSTAFLGFSIGFSYAGAKLGEIWYNQLRATRDETAALEAVTAAITRLEATIRSRGVHIPYDARADTTPPPFAPPPPGFG